MRRSLRAGLLAALGLSAALSAAGLQAPARDAPGEGPSGRVRDEASGAAVGGATLVWRRPGVLSGVGPSGDPVVADPRGAFRLPASWGPGGTVEVAALGYAPRVLAWEEAAAGGWRVELARDPLALDEIVVTVGATARRRSEIALPVESVEAAEIAAAGAASVDRLLGELPAVQIIGNAPTGSNLLIRGIGGARVLVLLDGQPVTGTLIENRDLSRMSLAGSDRVEIVKGPLSSLYGSDALGGVVNVITRLPAPGFRLDGRALSGGKGRQEVEATASGGGRLRYGVTGGWRQEDQVPGVVSGGQDAFARIWDLRSRLRYAVADEWEMRGGLTYLRERQRWPVGGGFSGFNDNTGASGWVETRRTTGSGEWNARIFAEDYEHLYRSARGDAPIAGDRANAQREQLVRATAGYSGSWGDHAFDVGVEGSARAIRSPDKIIEDRASDDEAALFAQDAWQLGATVVTGGMRLTRNSRWGSNLSPSLGLTRPVGDALHLRAAVARGFRAPSFKELGWRHVNLGAGYMVEGHAHLEPERSWSVSGGAEWRPADNVVVDAEVYSNRIDDLVELGFVGNAPSGLIVYSPRNLTDAVTRGFEISLRTLLGEGEFSVGYAYLDAYAGASRDPLDRRARHSGRARATWTPEALSGLRLDGTLHLTGNAPIVLTQADGTTVEAGIQERFTAVDLQAALPLLENLELLAGVDNLFDARPGGWQGIIERRFRLSVRLRDLFGD